MINNLIINKRPNISNYIFLVKPFFEQEFFQREIHFKYKSLFEEIKFVNIV